MATPTRSSQRRSIFSNGSPNTLRLNDPRVIVDELSVISSALPSSSSPANATMRTSSASSLPVLQLPPRPRIPHVEKDVDDHTNAPTDEHFRRDTSTPTTLTRLFAVNAPSGESRSTSFNGLDFLRQAGQAPDKNTLAGHLHTQGLLGGKYSDVTVHAFGNAYKLHRLLLARAPFFNTAFSGVWIESRSQEITLDPADVDSSITRQCFELALKRLYGMPDEDTEAANPIGFFATGCWLEMQDIIELSIANMLKRMTPETLTPLIKLVTNNYYGRAGDKILASSKAMLCRHGWRMPLSNWDGVPADIIREIVGGDGFFVMGEFDRWILATRILNRRLKRIAVETGLVEPGAEQSFEVPHSVKLMAVRFDNVYRRNATRTSPTLPDELHRWVSVYTHPDIEPLLVLLDEGIHYMHLNYEHLQYIRKATDVFGLPLMPDKVVSDALWMQLELRQKVINAQEDNLELGLSQVAEGPHAQPLAARESTMSMSKEPSSAKGKQRSDATTDELDSMVSDSWDGNGRPRKFWIPSADCNIVMGGSSGPVVATSPTPGAPRYVSRLSGTVQPEDVQWAADFGAATADSRPVTNTTGPSNQQDVYETAPPVSYSHFPPFRFAAEFANPRLLKGKKRFYSDTIFYAGSMWNIYIQKLRGNKLGVYLHRAKTMDGNDAAADPARIFGSVDQRIGALEREMLWRHNNAGSRLRRPTMPAAGDQGQDEDSSGSGDLAPVATRAFTQPTDDASRARRWAESVMRRGGLPRSLEEANARGHNDTVAEIQATIADLRARKQQASTSSHFQKQSGQDSTDDENLASDPELANLAATTYNTTLPPYVDARPKIKTYFKIYSPSKGGRMLSVYESVPSNFNFSQSWGWKSSTLMLDEFESDVHIATLQDEAGNDEAIIDAMEKDQDELPRSSLSDGKLRFMVVIGNV